MTAYSFKSYAVRERTEGERIPLVTVKHSDFLNNEHRAPFASGATAARALLVHAQRQLTDPARGPEYYNRLRKLYETTTVSGQRVKDRLRQRQARAAHALSNSDVELTGDQLQIVADVAMVQAELGEALLPAVLASGREADTVIDQIDTITRSALRSAALERTGEAVGPETEAGNWATELSERLADAPNAGQDQEAISARADLIERFTGLVGQLEETLPLAIDRDEPLYDIDAAIDPTLVAITSNRLSDALGADFNPDDLDQVEELSDQARAAIWESMSMDERQFSATKIALTPEQRIEVGMQIVNSTPSTIRLPEVELAQGRFDVRMATEEEARAMDALIRFAGEARAYPGPEIAGERVEDLKEVSMNSGVQGRYTIGMAVANKPAAIEHASDLITKLSAEAPETRLVIHADAPHVAEELQRVRTAALAAAGREASFKDGADASREFGGWTLADNGEDRILGADKRDASIFVANVDRVWAYNNSTDLIIDSNRDILANLSRTNSAARTTEKDLHNARKAFDASRDQGLVAKAKEIADAGRDDTDALKAANASADPKLRKEVQVRETAHEEARKNALAAERHFEKFRRQAEQDAWRTSSPGDLARATIVDLAQQQGKLGKVYVPAENNQETAVQTRSGALVEQRPYVAQQNAQRLRNGDSAERGNLRRLYHAQRGVNSTLVDGSNFFREDKGAAKGFQALRERIGALPKTATILTSNSRKNAISSEVVEKLGRPLIVATAWRVSDHSRPVGTDGRRVTLSDRKTELDLGFVGYKKQQLNAANNQMEDAQASRRREWTYKDLKGAVIAVNGGGSMTRDTYEAVQDLAAKKGLNGHSLSNKEVEGAYKELVENGNAHLEAPKYANPQLSRAIMQEALVDYAVQAEIASDMGKDYHSATLIRLAADADKLASVTDKAGKPVSLQAAYEHSLEYAHSIADNTRKDLDLTVSTKSEFGQLVLGGLPGVSSERASRLGETYESLGDVMKAAELGEASAALPKSLHHDIARPNAWSAATDRAHTIENNADRSGMDAVSVTNPLYPQTYKDAGRSDMLYTLGDVDLNKPTLAMVIGGNSKPLNADVDAVLAVAAEAKEKDWAVSIHMSGKTSAAMAKAIAEMPKENRPDILLVGDGHPKTLGSMEAIEAFSAVGHAGGGFITTTPPIASKDEPGEEPVFVANRRAALDLQGRQASAVMMVKSSGNDVELLALRSALEAKRPIAAMGPSNLSNPTVDDLRYRAAGYSANQRLLTGGDSVSVMLESRHMSFQPNMIPDMKAQTESRYIPFEGSTAGKMKTNERKDQEIDRSSVEAGARIVTEIAWREPAEYVANGRGTGDFLSKVEAGEAREIAASQADIAKRARESDARYLDASTRDTPRADVQAMFTEVNEKSQAAIDADTQQHFLAQRAAMGR